MRVRRGQPRRGRALFDGRGDRRGIARRSTAPGERRALAGPSVGSEDRLFGGDDGFDPAQQLHQFICNHILAFTTILKLQLGQQLVDVVGGVAHGG